MSSSTIFPPGTNVWRAGDRFSADTCASLRCFNAAGADPEGEISEIQHPETHLIPNTVRSAEDLQETVSI